MVPPARSSSPEPWGRRVAPVARPRDCRSILGARASSRAWAGPAEPDPHRRCCEPPIPPVCGMALRARSSYRPRRFTISQALPLGSALWGTHDQRGAVVMLLCVRSAAAGTSRSRIASPAMTDAARSALAVGLGRNRCAAHGDRVRPRTLQRPSHHRIDRPNRAVRTSGKWSSPFGSSPRALSRCRHTAPTTNDAVKPLVAVDSGRRVLSRSRSRPPSARGRCVRRAR